jgi:hypothetical protein
VSSAAAGNAVAVMMTKATSGATNRTRHSRRTVRPLKKTRPRIRVRWTTRQLSHKAGALRYAFFAFSVPLGSPPLGDQTP